ncbi:MAG: histidine kinase [Prevotella sp.]|nr:histidine kinase [Prevotella sp.]
MKIFTRCSKENLIYLGLWILLFLAPVVSLYLRSTSDTHLQFQWNEVFHVWVVFAIYLLIFLVHNIILAPILIYKHKTLTYIITTLCLLGVFMTFECFNKPDKKWQPRQEMKTPPKRPEPNRHPEDMKPENQPRNPFDNNHPPMNDRMHQPPMFIGMIDFVGVFILVGLLGLNLGVKLYFKNEKDYDDLQKLEKQNLSQQLEYLKYQINPHFFMNTLNNIHALVDIDPEKAKTSIVELSKMMRYVLYEGDKSTIPLQKEVTFLHNYIQLMQLRYSDRVTVNIDIPDNMPDGQIPPLLLITFVENAFKHGVSYQQDSFINIAMDVDDGSLFFHCLNRKQPIDNTSSGNVPQEGGVGLKNVKQRLDLIYGENYTLDINNGEENYEVQLTIPFQQ